MFTWELSRLFYAYKHPDDFRNTNSSKTYYYFADMPRLLLKMARLLRSEEDINYWIEKAAFCSATSVKSCVKSRAVISWQIANLFATEI